MDSFNNITSEKSSDFEDGICDPDLEARLYAEIYYSNETYAQDFEATEKNDTETAGIVQNVTSSLSTQTLVPNIISANVNLVLQNKENSLSDASLVVNYGLSNVNHPIAKTKFQKTHYRVKNWVLGESCGYNHKEFKHWNVKKTCPMRQRLLAHKGLWSNQETMEEHISIVSELAYAPSESLVTSATEKRLVETPKTIAQTNNCPIYHTVVDKQTSNVSCNNSCSLAKYALSRKKGKNAKKKILKTIDQIPTKAFRGTKVLRRCKSAVDGMGVTMDMSKCKVVSKKKKLKMREANPEFVEISSDSDASILEVPVPPKAPPPIIQLPDSDEDCDRTYCTREEKGPESVGYNNKVCTPCYVIQTDSSSSTESSAPLPEAPNLSNLNEIHDESMIDSAYTTEANICTNFQQDASSLTEIQKIREMGTSSHAHSDDSMTESEAINWVNIATGQVDITRNQEICLIDECADRPYGSPWDQLKLDNPTGACHPNKDLTNSSNKASLDETIDIPENDDNHLSISTNGEKHNERTKRKRKNDVDPSSFKEFKEPEIHQKRSHGNIDESCTEKSLMEYFFKPMSKELQAFYNNPWGGENLDLNDIQSRMPRNPSYWAILDDDLRPPSKRRGRTCPRCRTNSHFGKKCPEKATKPSCCMCGAKGHIETRCPQTMCLTCGHKYTTFRPTCGYCTKLSCNMCNGVGHTHENCPDLWRRYHDTTTETLPVPKDPKNIMKASQYLSCCNCAKRGHDSTMCKQLRWSQHFPSPTDVSSYIDGPVYLPTHHERIKDKIPSGYIGTPKVPDGGNALPINSSNSVSQDSLVFECSNFDCLNSISFHQISKRLDTLTNAHLGGLLSGDMKPMFLNMWQSNFVFNVRITHGPDELVLLVIQANSTELICGIEKLLIQWLTRSDSEKPYLIYDALPYGNMEQMTMELRQKLVQLRRVLEPMELLKKISACEEKIKYTSEKVSQVDGTKKTAKSVLKKNNAIEIAMRNIMNKRCELVTSLYGRSWVEGADIIVRSFRDLVHQLKWLQRGLSIEHYMEIVYLYNEIFTFHESDALTEALQKAKSVSQLSESVIPSLQHSPHDPVSSSNVNSPGRMIENPHVFGHKYSTNNEDRQFKNGPVHYTSPLASQCVQQSAVLVKTGAEYSPIPGNFEMIERFGAITTSIPTVTDVHCYIDARTASKSFSPNGFHHSPNSQQTLLLNHYGKAKRVSRKHIDHNEGLLTNLTKKKRKLFRRSARLAIKLANSSNIPRLQKMANALKLKIIDCSIRTDDVKSLQNAVSTNLSCNKAQMRQRSSKRQTFNVNGDNRAYMKFLKSL